jgi:hypothetical protein
MKKCIIGNPSEHCEYFDAPKVGYVVPDKLFGKDSNAKTKKGIPLGYSTYLIYLAPAKQNKFGKNLCSSATEGCTTSCLFTSGRGRMKPVEKARKNKAEYFLSDRDGFMTQVYKELTTAVNGIKKTGIPIAVRMNGTSDIPWENIPVTSPSGKRYSSIMEAFPNVQFYDYTKIYRRLGNTPKNYHLTFSRAETMKNKMEAKEALKRGFQVAAVFGVKKGESLPKTYDGYKVVDGDEHDLTFLQPNGVILGLRAKGDALKDESGFVIQTNKTVNGNKEIGMARFKKGSKEAKAYMAKLRRMKDSVGATLYIEKGETKRTKPKRVVQVKRTKTGLFKNFSTVSGWKKGTTPFFEQGERTKKGGILVTRRKKASGTAKAGSFRKFNTLSGLPNVGAVKNAIDDVKKHSDLINYYKEHIAKTKAFIKANGRQLDARTKAGLLSDNKEHLKTIAHHKKMLSQAKKMIK